MQVPQYDKTEDRKYIIEPLAIKQTYNHKHIEWCMYDLYLSDVSNYVKQIMTYQLDINIIKMKKHV